MIRETKLREFFGFKKLDKIIQSLIKLHHFVDKIRHETVNVGLIHSFQVRVAKNDS